MAKEINIGTLLGLNNRLPEARMSSATDAGDAQWLRVAKNVDFGTGGYLRRRQGFALQVAGHWHSIWADEQDAYAVVDGDLCRIDPDSLAPTVLMPAVGERRLRFARLPDGLVYWTNGAQLGRLNGAVASSAVTEKPNPKPTVSIVAGGLSVGVYQVCFTRLGIDGESASTEPESFALGDGQGLAFASLEPDTLVYATGANGEVFNQLDDGSYVTSSTNGAECATLMLSEMPAGQALAHYRGSLLVAKGNFLYISEPYRYGLFKPSRGFIPFPAEITVVAPCEDGVYVCADKTYWLPADPLNTNPVTLLPFGALNGAVVFDDEAVAVYWQTSKGLAVGKPSGVVSLPQNKTLRFDAADSGVIWLRESDGDKHLVTTRVSGEI